MRRIMKFLVLMAFLLRDHLLKFSLNFATVLYLRLFKTD